MSTIIISPNLNKKSIMLRRIISKSSGHIWQPAEFENVENPYFENLKQLQNPGQFLMTKGFMSLTLEY